MKNLLKINYIVYFITVFLIFAFLITIILMFNYKVEKSKILYLNVDATGKNNIITDAKTTMSLRDAKYIYVHMNDHSYNVSIENININNQKEYIITLKGINNLLPGEKIQVSIIYGYQSLIKSLISSGV